MLNDHPSMRGTPSPVDALQRFSHRGLRSGSAPPTTLSRLRYGVQIGELYVLVPAGVVSEIVNDLPVHSMPRCAPWFRGMINLRGHLVPVFDLRTLLSGEILPLARLVVLDRGERAVALAIDSLPESIELHDRVSPPALPGDLGESLRGAYLEQAQLWLEFDFDSLFRGLGARAGLDKL